MCLIQRSALEAAGNWSSNTICEDTDLGLIILERGWRVHYTNHRCGRGLLPQDYHAFRTQRDQWAGGAVQIVKKHWRQFLPGARLLTTRQKQVFLVGWLTWLGGDLLAVAGRTAEPDLRPVRDLQGCGTARSPAGSPGDQRLCDVAPAFPAGLPAAGRSSIRAHDGRHVPLHVDAVDRGARGVPSRTADRACVFPPHAQRRKQPGQERPFSSPAEALLGSLLVTGAIAVGATNVHRVLEADLFAIVLVLQSLPFWSAVGVAAFERIAARRAATEPDLAQHGGRVRHRFLIRPHNSSPLKPCLARGEAVISASQIKMHELTGRAKTGFVRESLAARTMGRRWRGSLSVRPGIAGLHRRRSAGAPTPLAHPAVLGR